MSILGAMFTAVSGLNAQSRSLGNISDNIANSQTVGYKKVDTRFSDIITISNKSLNLPGGVVASPYYANALQGNINQTQSTTNLAVSGQGFFVVSRPTDQTGTLTTFSALPYYTRAGDFEVNRDGYVVNGGGYYLNGWAVDQTTGVPDTGSLAPIQITQLTTPPNATSQIEVVGNLPATSVVNPDPALAPTNVKIYDALGNPHTVSLSWVKRADNIWNLDITAADSTLDPVSGTISGTNDQTAVAATTTPNTAGVAQVDTITVPATGLPPGRTLNFTIGANTIPVTAPVGGYTGAQLATALAAAINANAGMAAVVTAGNVAGNTLTVTADVPGTPFTGSLSGNGSGQIDTVTIPAPLAAAANTITVNVAGGGPVHGSRSFEHRGDAHLADHPDQRGRARRHRDRGSEQCRSNPDPIRHRRRHLRRRCGWRRHHHGDGHDRSAGRGSHNHGQRRAGCPGRYRHPRRQRDRQ